MVTYKFIKRHYPSGKDFWKDFYRNDVCVGELHIISKETNIWFEDCPASLGIMAGDLLHAVSFKDFAEKVEATHAFDHFYDYWRGHITITLTLKRDIQHVNLLSSFLLWKK